MTSEHDLGPLPKVHPRTAVVDRAERELEEFFFDWQKRHGLTTCEVLTIFNRHIAAILKYALAAERRISDPGKKVDEV